MRLQKHKTAREKRILKFPLSKKLVPTKEQIMRELNEDRIKRWNKLAQSCDDPTVRRRIIHIAMFGTFPPW